MDPNRANEDEAQRKGWVMLSGWNNVLDEYTSEHFLSSVRIILSKLITRLNNFFFFFFASELE